MKTINIVVWVLLVLVVAGVGYGVFSTNPTKSEVDEQLAEITPTEERVTVDPQILTRPIVSEIENYRMFGEQPVKVNPATLNRPNPFDNL